MKKGNATKSMAMSKSTYAQVTKILDNLEQYVDALEELHKTIKHSDKSATKFLLEINDTHSQQSKSEGRKGA